MKTRSLFPIVLFLPLLMMGCFKDSIDDPEATGNITRGLLAYYTFDDGMAYDATDNNAHASLLNGATIVNNNNDGGYYLSVSTLQGGCMNIPYNFFSGRNHWSVGFWIKDLSAGCVFAAQNVSNVDFDAFWHDVPKVWAKEDGQLRIETSEYTDGITPIAYNYIQNGDTWHYYVLVADGMFDNYRADIKFYVDGVLVDHVTPRYVQSTINKNTRIQFGGNRDGLYSIAPSMKIDNIRFYDRTLSVKEIKKIYNLEK